MGGWRVGGREDPRRGCGVEFKEYKNKRSSTPGADHSPVMEEKKDGRGGVVVSWWW